jgi:hypothetical protein
MSRSGYTDECGDDPLAHGRWRQAVKRSIQGKRGQALLQELAVALDEMEDKRLYPGSFATADGEFCTLGALGAKRGTKMADLGDEDDCDPALVGERFDIAAAMAAEIMYMNDEYAVDCWKWVTVEICGPMRPCYPDWGRHTREVRIYNESHPQERWKKMRAWVAENLSTQEAVAA